MYIKKKNILAILLAITVLLAVIPANPQKVSASEIYAEYYIDPINGKDSNKGTQDAPFATIDKAVSVVKSQTGRMTGDIYVYFADGRYELDKPVKFEQKSGGKDNYTVYYQAMEGANPIISGGKEITGWELFDEEKNIYRAKKGGVYSRHLVVDGALATRARSEGGLTSVRLDYGDVGLTCKNTEMRKWKNKDEIELIFIHDFMHRRILVDKIRAVDNETIQLVLEEKFWNSPSGTNKWVAPTYIENAYELLDDEGEFYNDPSSDYIYYKPTAKQDMENIHTVIPVLEEHFIVGGYNYSERTKNIVFRGLTFTDLTWMLPTTDRGYYSTQDGYVHRAMGSSTVNDHILINPASVTVQKSENIKVLDCTFKASGASAVRILEGSEKIDVEGNHIHDLGGGAIYVGNVRNTEINPKDTRKIVKDVNIKNNYIHHVAKENTAAAGISVGYPYNTSITHNEIHDVPYSGMHVGWGWGTIQEKTLKNFVFEYNYVHNFMKGREMLDGGGIYTLGYTSATVDNPNKITKNYFKDCYSASVQAGGMIYLDNTSSHWLIEGNVIDNILGSKKWDGEAFAQTTYTPLNNFWVRNYSTIPVSKYTNDTARNIVFEENQYHPTANWPQEARDVVNKSGLEKEYRYLSPRKSDYARVFTTEFINLNEGESYQLTPVATTEFCDEISMKNAKISYSAEKSEFVTVSPEGVIKALKNGQTKIITTVTIGNITHKAYTTVSIGAGLDVIQNASGTPNKLVKGETKQLPELAGISYGGNNIEGNLENISYSTSDPNILSLDIKNNTMTALNYGEAVLTYSGEYEGVTKTGSMKINVIDYADQSGLDCETVTIENLLADKDDWFVKTGNILDIPNGYAFEETSVAQYTKEKYQDQVFDFYMSLSKQATWPSITLRNQVLADGFSDFNSFYIFCFAKTGIELQRFNGQERTSIFCDLLPNSRIGKTHPFIFEAGKKYHVQIGTFNEENGVRIILNIDGENVINYLDETEGRISEPGYLGLMINSTTMSLTTK